MTKQELTIEGIVSGCIHNNKTDVDFPKGYVKFELVGRGEERMFLTGDHIPPIQNGNYVSGEISSRNTSRYGNVVIVETLAILDKKEGRILGGYISSTAP